MDINDVFFHLGWALTALIVLFLALTLKRFVRGRGCTVLAFIGGIIALVQGGVGLWGLMELLQKL